MVGSSTSTRGCAFSIRNAAAWETQRSLLNGAQFARRSRQAPHNGGPREPIPRFYGKSLVDAEQLERDR